MRGSKKIDIKYGNLFPWPFRLIAVLIVIAGLSLIIDRTLLSIFLMAVGGFVLSGVEGTEIDQADKSYRDYKSFFFLKSGSKVRYSGIEKCFVNTSKTKQKMHTAHTTKSLTIEDMVFNGFLKFDDGTKIKLLQKRTKEDLMRALEKIAKALNVPVEDNQ